MRFDGQALLMTPLAWYLSEPSAYSTRDLSRHAIRVRAGATAVTGLGARQVDSTRRISSPGTTIQVAKLLRLGPSELTQSQLAKCPRLPAYAGDLTWSSVERIVRDLAGGHEADRIAARHGVHPDQVRSVVEASKAWTAYSRLPLGAKSSEICPPRRVVSLSGWYELLDSQDRRLVTIAQDWAKAVSPESVDVGCALYDQTAVGMLQSIVDDLHGHATFGKPDDYGTVTVRFPDGKGRRRYGAWRTIRWLLAIVWISEYRSPERA